MKKRERECETVNDEDRDGNIKKKVRDMTERRQTERDKEKVVRHRCIENRDAKRDKHKKRGTK